MSITGWQMPLKAPRQNHVRPERPGRFDNEALDWARPAVGALWGWAYFDAGFGGAVFGCCCRRRRTRGKAVARLAACILAVQRVGSQSEFSIALSLLMGVLCVHARTRRRLWLPKPLRLIWKRTTGLNAAKKPMSRSVRRLSESFVSHWILSGGWHPSKKTP